MYIELTRAITNGSLNKASMLRSYFNWFRTLRTLSYKSYTGYIPIKSVAWRVYFVWSNIERIDFYLFGLGKLNKEDEHESMIKEIGFPYVKFFVRESLFPFITSLAIKFNSLLSLIGSYLSKNNIY